MEKEREKLWGRARLPTRHVHSFSHGTSEGQERGREILLFLGVGARSPWGTADNVSKTLTEWRRGMGVGAVGGAVVGWGGGGGGGRRRRIDIGAQGRGGEKCAQKYVRARAAS